MKNVAKPPYCRPPSSPTSAFCLAIAIAIASTLHDANAPPFEIARFLSTLRLMTSFLCC